MTTDNTNRYKKLVELAIEATRTNALEWKTAAGSDRFQAALPNFSLMILREPGRTTVSSILWSQDAPRYDYFVEVRDEDGNLIDEIASRDLKSSNSQYLLVDLFALARRSALGANEAIDEIVKNLNELTGTPF